MNEVKTLKSLNLGSVDKKFTTNLRTNSDKDFFEGTQVTQGKIANKDIEVLDYEEIKTKYKNEKSKNKKTFVVSANLINPDDHTKKHRIKFFTSSNSITDVLIYLKENNLFPVFTKIIPDNHQSYIFEL